jgi:hypothetical protein
MLVTLSARRIVGPDWVATMVVLIVVAPAIAGAVLGIAFLAIAFLAAVSGEPVAAAGGLLAVLVSLVAAELIGVPVTAPVGLVTAVLLRRLAGLAAARATRIAAFLAIGAAVAGLVTFLVAGPFEALHAAGFGPWEWTGASGSTRAEWVGVGRDGM